LKIIYKCTNYIKEHQVVDISHGIKHITREERVVPLIKYVLESQYTSSHFFCSTLEESHLILALIPSEARKTCTNTGCVIARTTSRAVSAGLISKTTKRVSAGGALLQITGRASVPDITKASHMLHCVPRSGVSAANLGSQVLLGPARTTVVTVVGAHSSLTGCTVITRKAITDTSLAVADTLVRALNPRM